MTRLRHLGTLLAMTVGLAVAIVALTRLGHGSLAAPPLRSFPSWLSEQGAATAAFAILRLVTLGAAWYLAASTGFAVLARATRSASLVTLADAASLPAVRRLATGVAGLGLSASAALSVAPVHRATPPPVAAPTAAGASTMTRVPAGAAIMRRLPDRAAVAVPGGEGTARMHRIDDRPLPIPAPAPTADDVWVVEPGDHLWRVAQETMTEAWGRPPADADVVPYWQAVIDANRSRLADPTNPDLLFAGQVLTLPPAPAPR